MSTPLSKDELRESLKHYVYLDDKEMDTLINLIDQHYIPRSTVEKATSKSEIVEGVDDELEQIYKAGRDDKAWEIRKDLGL